MLCLKDGVSQVKFTLNVLLSWSSTNDPERRFPTCISLFSGPLRANNKTKWSLMM